MAAPEQAAPAAAAAAAPPAGLQLKLLVDRPSRRVLYAEARKEAVDFLLGLLRLPVGLAARVTAKHGVPVAGAIGTLYASAGSLDDAYLLSPAADRDALLKPSLPSTALPLLDEKPAPPSPPPPPKRYFRCGGHTYPCRGNPTTVTDALGAACPSCRQPMNVEMRWVGGDSAPKAVEHGEGGYVKGVVSYLVMDDLSVTPMSTISAIMLLNKFGVKDVSTLDELTVDLGLKEGVKLLKASLESRKVLTDVFIEKKNGGVSIDRLG